MNRRITQQIAKELAHRLQKNDGGVVLLDGVMGAGKTTLVAQIVKLLAPQTLPCSPTYTLINQYTANIFHADLYRLSHADPSQAPRVAHEIGLYDLCVPGNYVFVEWSGDLQVPDAIRVQIKVKEDGNREFIIA